MAVLVTLLAVVLGLVVVLVAGLLRSHAEILRALHDLGVDLDPAAGSTTAGAAPIRSIPLTAGPPRTAADVGGVTPDGDAVHLVVTPARHPTLLAFLTSGCSSCLEFWRAFSAAPPDLPGGTRLVIVTKGPEAESPGSLRALAPAGLPVVMSTEAWEAYDAPVAPFFVLVDGPSGAVVGEGAASAWPQVVSLMAQAMADAGIAEPAAGGLEGRRRRAPGRPRSDAEREAQVDRDLMAAGILPGDPRLYPRPGMVPGAPPGASSDAPSGTPADLPGGSA
ncbi:MAG: hypothetical protein ACKOVH_07715 [Actinomycetota bacterium]